MHQLTLIVDKSTRMTPTTSHTLIDMVMTSDPTDTDLNKCDWASVVDNTYIQWKDILTGVCIKHCQMLSTMVN